MPSNGGKKGKDMIVKKLVSLMMLVVLAGLTAGDVCAAPKKNTNKRETTKTAAKSNAKPSKAAKAAPSKTEDIPAPVDEDQFVTDNLAQSGTGKQSKYFEPGFADEAERRLKDNTNYETMPSRYRKLVDANKDKYFVIERDGQKGGFFFCSEHFYLIDNHNRTIIKYNRLDSSDMMAIFESPVVEASNADRSPAKKSKTAFSYSKTLEKAIPSEDMVYSRKLSDTVNEVVTYLYDVPFFIPDMDRFKRGDYAGKFIPEKYLIKGTKLNKVSPELYDVEKKGYYARWGLPIYDVSQVETGEIRDVSGCDCFSKYDKLNAVNELILLNLDPFENKLRDIMIDLVRETQYKQTLSLLEGLKKVPDLERQANDKSGKLNKIREQMIAEVEKHLQKIIPSAEKTLNEALQQKKFIYSINNPQGKPKKIELKDAGIANTEYTTGNVRN